ncbi:MAG TPA: hypothetical protein PKB02_00685 [Anaerohalosphaeraceae bacterium]|nr:hypothetical protein [Anaerohalosphaeraceae bacterium]
METVVPTEKARNYPGEISLWCGVTAFVSGILFSVCQSNYNQSLFTENIWIYGDTFGFLWLIASFLGLLCWLISLFLIVPVWKKRYCATGAILGILLPSFTSSLISPRMGASDSTIYYRVSDPRAIRHLQELSPKEEGLDWQFLKDNYEQDYYRPTFDKHQTADRTTETIIVEYKLRQGIEREDLPKSFTVIIDRKTRKTTVLPGNETEENNVEK